MRKRLFAALIALMLLPSAVPAETPASRMPGPAELTAAEAARVSAAGQADRDPWLDAAFTLLEEGNPFVLRYNLLSGAEVRARMPFGVPYLWGGRAANHLFAKEPDYVVEPAWSSSPDYYIAGRKYLYGFDCVGFVRFVWSRVRPDEWPGCDAMLADRTRHILGAGDKRPDWPQVAAMLKPGDLLVLRHPGNHVAIFIGTLRGFGYTEEDVPALAAWLDYPLVIHSACNAAVADRFAWLLKNGLPKYRAATPPDGGVCVSLLGAETDDAPGHVFQQNQHTWYFTLPDGTWLTVLHWRHVADFCFWRADEVPEP